MHIVEFKTKKNIETADALIFFPVTVLNTDVS